MDWGKLFAGIFIAACFHMWSHLLNRHVIRVIYVDKLYLLYVIFHQSPPFIVASCPWCSSCVISTGFIWPLEEFWNHGKEYNIWLVCLTWYLRACNFIIRNTSENVLNILEGTQVQQWRLLHPFFFGNMRRIKGKLKVTDYFHND